jgi:prolipoprotein diacylglyceryltransferase
MSFFWGVLSGIAFVIAVITLVDVVRHRRDLGTAKLCAFILLIIILPFIGSIIYWLTRKPSQEEIEQTRLAQESYRQTAARQQFGP